MLDEETAAGNEAVARAGNDRTQRAQSVIAGTQRDSRLEAQIAFGQMGITRSNVRWITEDGIERLDRYARIPVGVNERYVMQREPLGVLARDGQSLLGHVGPPNARVRPFVRYRKRDRAGAGAKVDDTQGSTPWKTGQRFLDERFRLRTRNQYGGRNRQRKAPELALAGQIGDRLTVASPFRKRKERLCL